MFTTERRFRISEGITLSKKNLKEIDGLSLVRQPGIYLIGSSAHGWYKAGLASDLYSRLGTYMWCPFPLDTLYVWLMDHETAAGVEKFLHSKLIEKRHSPNGTAREWYELTREDLAEIRLLVAELLAGQYLALAQVKNRSRRYQRGSVSRYEGKRGAGWFGTFREDIIKDGKPFRQQRHVRLGTLIEVPTKETAAQRLREIMMERGVPVR